jgi:Protein kinase domain
MSGDQVLLEVAAAVADGSPVDWAAIEGRVSDEHDRKLLRNLQMLANVGNVHETTLELPGPGAPPLPPSMEETVSATSAAARRWGRYELRARLGEGGQGTVYRAWDPQLECEVALKVLQPHHAAVDIVGDRILREGRALARVRDPHVVNVYNVERHEGQIGLCMEFIKGQTLEDILTAQGPFGPHEAAAVGICVGRALAKVHDAGLIHRDVKTRNVMREEKGRIVLMDFGTGRDSAQLRAGGAELAGTPLYMAPEVLSGAPATHQSDIYSVGVLLYHLVTGRFPIEGRSFDEIVQAHKSQRRKPLTERRPDLPDDFIRIIERAIAPDPAARYETVGLMVHDMVVLEAKGADQIANPWTTGQRVAFGAGLVGATAVACLLLGFINSMAFNAALERTAVAHESISDWLTWGAKSLIGPIANLAQVAIGVLAVAAVWRFLRKLSHGFNRWSERTTLALSGLVRSLGLREPEAFGQFAFVLGLGYLLIVVFAHGTLTSAMFTFLSHMTPQQLAVLAPTNADEHYSYRSMLDLLVLGSGLSLYWLLRLNWRRSVAGIGAVAAVGALFALATLMWDAPYRLLFQSERPRVLFENQRCYDLGKNDEETLLYCPEAADPRVRRARTGDPRLHDTDVTESIFTPK